MMILKPLVFMLLYGSQWSESITVSPDLGLKKSTKFKFLGNITNDYLDLSERYKRLIPYMTFYIPTEVPTGQSFNYVKPVLGKYDHEQKKFVQFYEPQYDINIEQYRPHQAQNPNRVIGFYDRPEYQSHQHIQQQQQQKSPQKEEGYSLNYKTTLSNTDEANYRLHSQQTQKPIKLQYVQQSKENFNPFTDENKIPGPFRPIVYADDVVNTIKYNSKVNTDVKEQFLNIYEEIPVYGPQHQVQPIIRVPELQTTKVKQPYRSQQTIKISKPQNINTPEQKYIAYLQQQIPYEQQTIKNNQRPEYINTIRQNSAPSGAKSNQIFYNDFPTTKPLNHYEYQTTNNEANFRTPTKYQNYQSNHPSNTKHNNDYLNIIDEVKDKNRFPIKFISTIQPNIVSVKPTIVYKTTHQPIKYVTNMKLLQKQKENIIPIHSSLQNIGHGINKGIKIPINYPSTNIPTPTKITTPIYPTSYPNKYSLQPEFYISKIIPNEPKPIQILKNYHRPIIVKEHKIISTTPKTIVSDIKHSSLAEILRKLQESNHLPKTLTPDNIDNSIKTLIKILNNLKESEKIAEVPQQHHEETPDYDYEEKFIPPKEELIKVHGPNTGKPGIDYPILSKIPSTSFNCKEQRYKGFFADPESNCQVWHYCDLNGGQASFLCPNGTIFSQVALTCDWWFNVKCSSTAQLYVLNERLYKYILPFTPKFPEDYSGPLVDKYLAMKFQEMEEKMQKQRLKGREKDDMNNENNKNNENTEIDEYDNSSIDTGLPYTTISTTASTTTTTSQLNNDNDLSTIIIPSSTPATFTSTNELQTNIESEKVELVEIISDGASGHLIPDQQS